jgi:hypothetical protein
MDLLGPDLFAGQPRQSSGGAIVGAARDPWRLVL